MRALILGILGQDGSYLAEQLQARGYEVWGMTRRQATLSVPLVTGDLLDQASLERALVQAKPDEVYNLAAVTAPGQGWGVPQPPLLCDVTGVGVVRLLEAMLRRAPQARLVHASSSAIYDPQRYGLYGAAKQLAHSAIVGYRNQLHCSNAVLFSHTSPRQDPRFLARRITSTVARIAKGSGETLVLGDVESRRDWGYAPDYCEALQLIAQHEPGDWVISTGRTHSVRELVQVALDYAGLRWDDVVNIDPAFPRVPNEIPHQEGRQATAKALGWAPRTGFADMVELMVREAMDGAR